MGHDRKMFNDDGICDGKIWRMKRSADENRKKRERE